MLKKVMFYVVVVMALFSCASNKSRLSNEKYEYYDGINYLNNTITKQLGVKSKNLRIAIMPLLNENGDRTLLGENIANLMHVGLFEKNNAIVLVERERIDSLYEEINFGLNGNINENDLYKIGNMLSVDAVLVGTIRSESDYFSIYLRLVNIEKGNVIALSQVLISKNDNIQKQFNTIYKYSNNNYSGGYILHLINANISEKDENGMFWDAFSRADIMFQIDVNGVNKYNSQIYSDFPQLDLDENIELVLENNNVISITLFDSDLTSNQKIGQINLTPDDIKYLIRNNTKTYSSGSIKELAIELSKK